MTIKEWLAEKTISILAMIVIIIAYIPVNIIYWINEKRRKEE